LSKRIIPTLKGKREEKEKFWLGSTGKKHGAGFGGGTGKNSIGEKKWRLPYRFV